ncbi:MAG: site-specific integrase [Treponema sp.]|jgi:site-specific recombinase XerD|nr:site-specific integrase [Treponema sp.]
MTVGDWGNVLEDFKGSLAAREKSPTTVKCYARNVGKFIDFLQKNNESCPTRQNILAYKEYLLGKYKAASANIYLISLNVFLRFLGEHDLRVKTLRIQRKTSLNNVISEEEYRRMLENALKKRSKKLYFLIRTLAAGGIRVGELQHITVDMLKKSYVMVESKRKVREIRLPDRLREELLTYCAENDIRNVVFCGRDPNKMLHTSYIWTELKKLARLSGVPGEKVYSHVFRHLFAKKFISQFQDIAELADILGHSSIETTRIYTRTTAHEKQLRLNSMNL